MEAAQTLLTTLTTHYPNPPKLLIRRSLKCSYGDTVCRYQCYITLLFWEGGGRWAGGGLAT